MLPSIPVSNFINPEPQSRAHKALCRAIELKPDVQLIGTIQGERYFRVVGRGGSRYVVTLWLDEQGEPVAQCNCEAFYVPQEPTHCFHVAGVLIHESAESTGRKRL